MSVVNPNAWRRGVGAVAAAIVVVAFALTLGRASFQPKTFAFDLLAFYCGGTVVAEHRDPYVAMPLGSCEHRLGTIFRPGTSLVIPVPIPAYDLAALEGLSFVPYPAARVGWLALELCACALSAFLLARLTGLRLSIVAATLVVSDLYCSSLLGQLAAFGILGIVVAGWALERGKPVALFAGLSLAMIEPHVGLPIVCAVLLFGGRFRIVAAACVATLAAVSVAVMPLPWLVDYFSHVLNAQALSEINNQDQLSSLYVLHAAGLSESTALAIAKLNYAVALVAGVVLARASARTLGPGMLAFAPMLLALLGGPYLHVTQVAAALPAALLVASRTPSRSARWSAALLTVPWLNFVSIVTVLPVAVGALYVVLRKLCDLPIVRALALALVALGAETAAAFAIAAAPQAGIPVYGVVGPATLPETTWRAIIDLQGHGHVLLSCLAKIPTAAGILALVFAIVRRSSLKIGPGLPTIRESRSEGKTAISAMPQPSISVVVPSLDQGHFIGETIDSILAQNVPGLEVIVVDGGSTDTTIDVLRSYGDGIVWTSEPDRGQSDAINKGLQRARGEIVCYLNSDDLFEPGALQAVLAYFAAHPEAAWLFGRCRIVDGDGRPARSFVDRYKSAWGKYARHRLSLLVLNYVPQPATFWRASAMQRVGPIDESLFYAMDYDLWLRLSTVGAPGFVDRYLASFRVHDRSKSLTGAAKQLREASEVARRHGARALVPLHRLHDRATLAIYRAAYGQASAARAHNETRPA